MAIDSRLAWYAGDIQEAAQLLDTLGADNSTALAFVREEQEYRAAASGDWLIAAKAVYQQALTAKVVRDEQALGDKLFNYLLRLPDATVDRQIDLARDDPAWHAWLEMQVAYRLDQTRFTQWLNRNARLISHPPLPRHLLEWTQGPELNRVTIILPLDGNLAAAGEGSFSGGCRATLFSLSKPCQAAKTKRR
jgi:hypothetical protein